MAKGKEKISVGMWRLPGLLAAVLCIQVATAQVPPKITWGPAVEKAKPDELLHLFGAGTGVFYTLTSQGRKGSPIHLSTFDTDSMHVVNSRNLLFPDIDGVNPLYLEPLVFAGKAYILVSVDDPSTDDVRIYAFEIAHDLLLKLPANLLGIMPREVLLKSGYFNVAVAEGGQHLLVLLPQESEPARNEKFNLRLLNEKLELVKEKELELPHFAGEVVYSSILADGASAVYALMNKPTALAREISKVQQPGRDHYLLKYSWGENTISEKALSIGAKWIFDARMVINSTGDLQVAGYYSNMIDLVMAGTFSVSFDRSTGAITDKGLSPFDRPFKSQFRPMGNLSERAELGLFQTDYLLASPGKEVMLISEKRDIQNTTVFNPATGTYYMVQNYLYEEMLVSTISLAGAAIYNFKIPKYQSSARAASDVASYILWQGKNSTFLIFNDHERNASLDIHSAGRYTVLSSVGNAQAVMYQLDQSGGLYKNILFKNSPQRGVMSTRFYHTLPEGLIVFTSSNSGYQFGKIHLGPKALPESE